MRVAMATVLRGWALAKQEEGTEGIAQLRQGLASYRASGAAAFGTYYLALLGARPSNSDDERMMHSTGQNRWITPA
jgi:hypothetical protein